MEIPELSFRARSRRLAASCAMLFFVTACSNGAPTSPSAAGGPGAQAPGGTAGAVIEGTVSGGGATASSFRDSDLVARTATSASMAGLRVRVAGTDLSTTVTDSGTFRLEGVPGGTIRLQFQSESVNAATDLPNVSGDQVIVVQVQVGATSAVIVSEVREGKISLCHAESGSRYHMITVATSAEPAHRAHGDGEVGDHVPGRPSMTFSETCTLLGPGVEIEKSTNGEDADNAPGPEIEVGDPVAWTYVVKNTGTINLTNVVVSDDKGVAVACPQTSLAAGASMTCTGSGVATLGQYMNVGTVTADWMSSSGGTSGVVTDSDASHYRGVDPENEEEGDKITLCHKTGAGFYVKINVGVDAEPAHRAHGDAEVGEAVPGMTGKAFSSSCVPQ